MASSHETHFTPSQPLISFTQFSSLSPSLHFLLFFFLSFSYIVQRIYGRVHSLKPSPFYQSSLLRRSAFLLLKRIQPRFYQHRAAVSGIAANVQLRPAWKKGIRTLACQLL